MIVAGLGQCAFWVDAVDTTGAAMPPNSTGGGDS